jgi:hypothetical protein
MALQRMLHRYISLDDDERCRGWVGSMAVGSTRSATCRDGADMRVSIVSLKARQAAVMPRWQDRDAPSDVSGSIERVLR